MKRRLASEHRHGKQDISKAFHISIAWTLGEPLELRNELLSADQVVRFMQTEARAMKVTFEAAKAKIGNAVYSVGLALNAAEDRGILR